MGVAEIIYEEVKALSQPLAREVLDFVVFLRDRERRLAWRDLMDAQAKSLAWVWENADDQIWDRL